MHVHGQQSRKSLLDPHTPTPIALCPLNDQDTWPHLLFKCENQHLEGLRIARHNKAMHLITQTLQTNKQTITNHSTQQFQSGYSNAHVPLQNANA